MPIGAIAGVVGGLLGSSGAGKAADAQVEGAEIASETSKYFYDQTRADQAPYRDVGENALYRLADHYGLGYGGSGGSTVAQPQAAGTWDYEYIPGTPGTTTQVPIQRPSPGFQTGFGESNQGLGGSTPTYDFNGNELVNRFSTITQGALPGYLQGSYTPAPAAPAAAPGPTSTGNKQGEAWNSFFTSPDYQFRLDEGIRGIENSMLARGKGLSGNTAKAITGYSGDLASGEWNSYANRLASLAGVGQTATNSLSTIGANTAANMGNSALNAGQARGSGYIGQADAWGNAVQNVAGAAGWGNWNPFNSTPTGSPTQADWNSFQF